MTSLDLSRSGYDEIVIQKDEGLAVTIKLCVLIDIEEFSSVRERHPSQR